VRQPDECRTAFHGWHCFARHTESHFHLKLKKLPGILDHPAYTQRRPLCPSFFFGRELPLPTLLRPIYKMAINVTISHYHKLNAPQQFKIYHTKVAKQKTNKGQKKCQKKAL